MSSAELGLFSYEILGLVGRGGAGAHDLLRMARRGRMLDWAGESQYYAEPKRLAKLGYLDARTEPGKTRERTVYTLTEKGLAGAARLRAHAGPVHAAEERPAPAAPDLRPRRRGPSPGRAWRPCATTSPTSWCGSTTREAQPPGRSITGARISCSSTDFLRKLPAAAPRARGRRRAIVRCRRGGRRRGRRLTFRCMVLPVSASSDASGRDARNGHAAQ